MFLQLLSVIVKKKKIIKQDNDPKYISKKLYEYWFKLDINYMFLQHQLIVSVKGDKNSYRNERVILKI